ncbi:TMV resistance protein N, partial [Mucuna pruriens]
MQPFSHLVVPFKFAAFLCFRGDTRYTFTENLFQALLHRGFRTFKDNPVMERGTRITVELPRAIEVSRVFIIVLSKNFASSSYCLFEVVKILDEFAKGKGRWILPVFYYVDPSDLLDTYEQALIDMKEWYSDEQIQEWRTALSKLSKNKNGCENKFEYQHIEDILKEVSRHVTSPIGLGGRILTVNLLLCSGSDRIHMIGICGGSGIGKTMVALELLNFHADMGFDHCFFFSDVGEILSKFGNVEGMSILNGKKVFIVFEDIKQSEQLDNIRELTKQLGFGSKVIIISQDKNLLTRCGIENIYEGERFSDTEAYQLLSLKVFNSTSISPKFVKILERIVTYALGHPRTLEVIGSNVSGKTIKECESALLTYESITNRDIQKIEEESFNALEKCQQEMLIHIALCLRGLELVDVEAKLHNKYEVCPRKDIRVMLHASTQDMIKDKVSHFEAMWHGHGQHKSNDIKYEQHDKQYKEDILELGPFETKNPCFECL